METSPGQPDEPLHEYLRLHARRQPDKAACLWLCRLLRDQP